MITGIRLGNRAAFKQRPVAGWPARASLSRAVSTGTLGAFRGGVAGLPALVRKKDQTADEARALLGESNP